MAKVRKQNGEGGGGEGMFIHAYSGKPSGSYYEFRVGDAADTAQGLGAVDPNDYVGSTFKVQVEARLVGVSRKDMNDGVQDVLSLRVVNSAPLVLIERGHKHDPNQTTIDGESPNDAPGSDIRGHGFGSGDTPTTESREFNPQSVFSDADAPAGADSPDDE